MIDGGPKINTVLAMISTDLAYPIALGGEPVEQAATLWSKSIRYVGATGALSFDENGDVQAPKMTWKLQGDENIETGYMSTAEVAELIQKLDN